MQSNAFYWGCCGRMIISRVASFLGVIVSKQRMNDDKSEASNFINCSSCIIHPYCSSLPLVPEICISVINFSLVNCCFYFYSYIRKTTTIISSAYPGTIRRAFGNLWIVPTPIFEKPCSRDPLKNESRGKFAQQIH